MSMNEQELLKRMGLFGPAKPPTIFDNLKPMTPEPGPNVGYEGPRQSGISGVLSKMFGGRDDPRLGRMANEDAGRRAMLNAGVAGLAAANRPGGTFGQALTAAMGTAAQAGPGEREATIAKQQQERIRQMVQGGQVDPQMLGKLYVDAVASGDINMVRSLGEVLKSANSGIGGQTRLQTPKMYVGPDGEEFMGAFNPATGQVERIEGAALPARAMGSSSNLQNFGTYMDAQGNPFYGAFNRATGRIEPVGGATPGEGTGTGQERMNARLAGTARAANEVLLNEDIDLTLGGILPAVTMRGGAIPSAVANMALSQDQQHAVTAALNFLNPAVRYLSGAQMTEAEARRYGRALFGAPGDTHETLIRKRQMRQNLLVAMDAGDDSLAGGGFEALGQLENYRPPVAINAEPGVDPFAR